MNALNTQKFFTPLPTLFSADEIVTHCHVEPVVNDVNLRIFKGQSFKDLKHAVLHIHVGYPRIASEIKNLWGTDKLHDYLIELLIDDRPHRQGFPDHVMSALMYVQNQHNTLFSFDKTPVWNMNNRYK